MAITNGYTTLAQYKKLHRADDSPQLDDPALEVVIEAASRAVDMICGRRFYVASETRYYTAQTSRVLYVDDLTGISTLQTDDDGDATYETTWTTSDYLLMPLNAALDGRPYTYLELAHDGDYTFPKAIKKGVLLTATFGYSATAPTAVRLATELAASRYWARKDTPLGVSASAALGQLAVVVREMEQDPDIMILLADYRKLEYGIA